MSKLRKEFYKVGDKFKYTDPRDKTYYGEVYTLDYWPRGYRETGALALCSDSGAAGAWGCSQGIRVPNDTRIPRSTVEQLFRSRPLAIIDYEEDIPL